MIRVGIINIMPKVEAYEPLLVAPLARAGQPVELVWIRLETHRYHSSDRARLEREYVTWSEAGALDGLVVTGAPVEELAFADVAYWPELARILDIARSRVRSTLGLCWGGLALAHMLGIPKLRYPQKLFGVYEHRRLVGDDHPLVGDQAARFPCAHSRHAGIADWELQIAEADGRVRLLGHAPETGYALFETPDHRYVAHLGHPEYVADRLVYEYRRDLALGRTDVPTPHGFDPDRDETRWADHRNALFARWVALLGNRE
ncbi:MAG TPA: homoserine O-succinyltransferase [Kofleriaceae bacterium]|jgi:homoserine O-succinyltransferase